MRDRASLYAFSVLKHGAVHQVRIDLAGTAPSGTLVRSLTLQTQTEGCVVDPRSRTLFVGEEDRGIWAFDARPDGAVDGRLVAPVDGVQLVADVEGLALAPRGRRGGWLIASSQGDNGYALYRLPDLRPAGRFRIAAGALGAVQETDGIAFAPGGFGAGFGQGLFVAQDGDNAPRAQNFKLVAWRDVMRALAGKAGAGRAGAGSAGGGR
ncbi:phytase [Sphingomonas changnyeongensis]|uniref:phytase n=1 Tax=Sphingomonas changnyeongensis TaxID=2698679 RepID=UPI002286A1A0|nr:phytase [Sphingomonas changnyeongensis]